MNRWFRSLSLAALIKGMTKRQNRQCRKQMRLGLERLEDRCVPAAAVAQHVLLLSVDGLHQADLTDPRLAQDLTAIHQLQEDGVSYTNASTTKPSDSFPGTLAYLTGAGPATTGVYYDDAYSRSLLAPGSTSSATPGTEVQFAENLDKNTSLLSGGGNFDASSIDPTKLPIDPVTHQVVYPNQVVKTNTIFDVAHDAGLYTAFSDKHPAYELVTGPKGNAVNDLYMPEVNSFTALYDPSTGKTVNADALLNSSAPVPAGISTAPGYTARTFATAPAGTSEVDSIAVDGLNVYVGYANGAAKDGSSGHSTIVQYTTDGKIVKTFTVAGHNDGLKVDPSTHKVWAIQNEDANPTLVIIDPTAGTQTAPVTLGSLNGGGGFDDVTFAGGKTYLSVSNPAKDPNSDPAVVQVTVSGSTLAYTTILAGNAKAYNPATGQIETLNLQDPDSMTTDLAGNLVLTSQSDNELVTIVSPGTPGQYAIVRHLTDSKNTPVSVDDTLYTPNSSGEVLVTDLKTGAIYQVTVPVGSKGLSLSAARDIGQVGIVNASGTFTPVISGLGSPRGLAFINAGPLADLSKYTLVDASTDPVGPGDPNLEDTTKNVLLAEKYDDLKVQAILNEIQGEKSHEFYSTVAPKVPAIFGMNFQAVSIAEKDAKGGIGLLPNGQEGAPSAILESALLHTDQSIARIEAALKDADLWTTTEMFVTAKHGQTPRVGSAGLIKDDSLTNVLAKAGVDAAFATGDDGSLIWLKDQSQTAKAVSALKDFQKTGTLDVYFQGVMQTLPAGEVIDKILSGKGLLDAGLGNPAKDSTSPDLVVVLKPGYILVGNPLNFAHKNAEHGGFSEDDTHVPLIVTGGAVVQGLRGKTVDDAVQTKQIAVTALDALGLDPKKLKGAVKEGTKELPGLVPPADPLQKIDHFVVIYQENWSFDGLYGNFPGANGIADASATSLSQIDRLTGQTYTNQIGQPFDLSVNGPKLTTPPQPINNGAVDPRFPPGLDTLHPYDAGAYLSPGDKTGDIVHRYWQEQSQIDGGQQNQYVTWSDNPGLVMSHFDATNLPEGLLAQQYTMDDNFFHASFGGSFLNHQFLVSAAAPVYPNAPASMQPTLDASGQLALDPATGKIIHDGNITPIGGKAFGDPNGPAFTQNYAVNTIFSKNLAPSFIGNTTSTSLLPSQNDSDPTKPNYIPTIGDRLDQASVGWKWYSGGWDAALASSPSNPANGGKTPANPTVDPNFQWHHQPLAYYDNFAPWLPSGQRNPLSAAHLQDETNFFSDLSTGNLPAVSFIKPIGADNEHPGYASLLQGQQHVADIVHAVQNSPDWAHTAIIITYDENGGRWDHVSAPDANGIWGDGTRVPGIVISPYSKQGVVDHTEHDTLSILKSIETRFGVKALNQYDDNASTLSSSLQSKPHVSIGSAYAQPDADNPGKFTLIVQGTAGSDNIHVSHENGQIRVRITGDDVHFDKSFAQPLSRMEVYGLGGGDHIKIDPDVTLPALVFTGSGDNEVHAGGGASVLVGGDGENELVGGSGPSILIGGSGEADLKAGSGAAIEIAGTTKFDANAEALRSFLLEWSGTDSYQLKVQHITGATGGGKNGTSFLDTTTVQSHYSEDELRGSSRAVAQDLIFAHLAGKKKDKVSNLASGDVIIEI